MTRSFNSLDAALTAWGKYSDFPYKRQAARTAYEKMVGIRGVPDNDAHGRPAFYIVDTEQYVAVRWHGSIGLMFQAGFITSAERLTAEWVPSPRATDTEDGGSLRWRHEFPDHVRFQDAKSSPDSRLGECTCSPGMLQPVGSQCSYCEELIGQSESSE